MAPKIALCRYQYDPLNRLASCTPLAEAIAQRFYRNDQLVTELQGTEQRSLLRAHGQLLARLSQASSALLATDQQGSVLQATSAAAQTPVVYSAYGHRPEVAALPGLPGFTGEQPSPVTGHYLLGNGYRAYNPVLMRFNSPDSWSPFGRGGLNAYAYCVGDPVNRSDPTGHVGRGWTIVKNLIDKRNPTNKRWVAQVAAATEAREAAAKAAVMKRYGSRTWSGINRSHLDASDVADRLVSRKIDLLDAYPDFLLDSGDLGSLVKEKTRFLHDFGAHMKDFLKSGGPAGSIAKISGGTRFLPGQTNVRSSQGRWKPLRVSIYREHLLKHSRDKDSVRMAAIRRNAPSPITMDLVEGFELESKPIRGLPGRQYFRW